MDQLILHSTGPSFLGREVTDPSASVLAVNRTNDRLLNYILQGACVAAAALMQYFFMAALCWMLVDGIHLYLFTVKVYNVSHKMLVYHLLSWGKPIMVKIKLYRFRSSCNVSYSTCIFHFTTIACNLAI